GPPAGGASMGGSGVSPFRRTLTAVVSAFRRTVTGPAKAGHYRRTLILFALLGAAACNRARDTGKLTIAVIPKGTSHVFWQSIHAGAEKAAQELGVGIVWRGPLREDDRSSQVNEVQGFITRGVSGIVLAPLDDSALAPPVAD